MKKLLIIPILLLLFSCTKDEHPCDEPILDWEILDEYKELVDEKYAEYKYYVKFRYKATKPTCYEYNYGIPTKLGGDGKDFMLGIRQKEGGASWLKLFYGDTGWTDGEWVEFTIVYSICRKKSYVNDNNVLIEPRGENETEYIMAIYHNKAFSLYGEPKTIKGCY